MAEPDQVDLTIKGWDIARKEEEKFLGRRMIKNQEQIKDLENIDNAALTNLYNEFLIIDKKEKYNLTGDIDQLRKDFNQTLKRDETKKGKPPLSPEQQDVTKLTEIVNNSRIGKGKKLIQTAGFGLEGEQSAVDTQGDELLTELADMMSNPENPEDELVNLAELNQKLTDEKTDQLVDTLIALQIARMEAMGVKQNFIDNGFAHLKEMVEFARNAPERNNLSVLMAAVHDFEKYGGNTFYLGEHETASAMMGSLALKKVLEADEDLASYAKVAGKFAAKSILLHGKGEFPEAVSVNQPVNAEEGIYELFGGVYFRQRRPGEEFNFNQLFKQYVSGGEGTQVPIGWANILFNQRKDLIQKWFPDKQIQNLKADDLQADIETKLKAIIIEQSELALDLPDALKKKINQIRLMFVAANGLRAADMVTGQTAKSAIKYSVEGVNRDPDASQFYGNESSYSYLEALFAQSTIWYQDTTPFETGLRDKFANDLVRKRMTLLKLSQDIKNGLSQEELEKIYIKPEVRIKVGERETVYDSDTQIRGLDEKQLLNTPYSTQRRGRLGKQEFHHIFTQLKRMEQIFTAGKVCFDPDKKATEKIKALIDKQILIPDEVKDKHQYLREQYLELFKQVIYQMDQVKFEFAEAAAHVGPVAIEAYRAEKGEQYLEALTKSESRANVPTAMSIPRIHSPQLSL